MKKLFSILSAYALCVLLAILFVRPQPKVRVNAVSVCRCGCGLSGCDCDGLCLGNLDGKPNAREILSSAVSKPCPPPAPRMPYADEDDQVVQRLSAVRLLPLTGYWWNTSDVSPIRAPVRKPLDFDIAGSWKITLTNPVGGEKWEAVWNLKKKSLEAERNEAGKITAVLGGEWAEQHSKGTVFFNRIGGADGTQLLRWERGRNVMFLEIEKIGDGVLVLGGTEGNEYIAARIEGVKP